MHLVETNWLSENLGNENLVVLDATWHMPNLNKDARQEYWDAHIDGAVFFDIDRIADTSVNLPHMLPDEALFNAAMDEMGITNDHHIVVYDGYGFLSSARAWWTFKVMGHEKVSILNGGLKKWNAESRATTAALAKANATNGYKANLNASSVKDIAQMHAHVAANDIQTLDARSAGRFSGVDPEPRAGLSSGHMPNGFNLPFVQLANDDGTVVSKAEIESLLSASGIDMNMPIVTTCGSGITAANLWFAMDYIGIKNLHLFDGSWTEYAQHADSVIVKD
ncbi:MAG: 3-mercaptopyruvate sulfurtransferase [Hyphomicrobiales bacterium]|nr:MAG: 3-mercaptopyruvate sulfurtransferase [Hyphomicrobiales bacterium]